MKKRWLLVSLALLVPKIVTGETLNLNYEKPGAFDLDPRLGLQARACLSKVEPMDIHFKFKPMETTNLKVTLTVDGAPVSKSYAPFSSATNNKVAGSTNTDPDFQIPWKVSVVSGHFQLTGTYNRPDVGSGHPESYTGEFCFSDDYMANNFNTEFKDPKLNESLGYFPLFKKFPKELFTSYTPWGGMSLEAFAENNELAFQNLCVNGKRQNILDPAHVWPNPPPTKGYSVPAAVKDKLDVYGAAFLKGGMFFLNYTPHKDDDIHRVDSLTGVNVAQELTGVPGPVTYTFPITRSDQPYFNQSIQEADVDLRLNNRNVSSLILKLTDGANNSAVWEWKTTDGSSKNKLHLIYRSQLPVKPAGNDNGDIYHINGFYKPEAENGVNGYYKGTLVSGSFLNQKYKDFVDNIMPLSLPPDVQGDIDLVNTDSLTFIIGQEQNYSGQYVVSVSGKPLKFGPLIMDDNELKSAMQVRNACY